MLEGTSVAAGTVLVTVGTLAVEWPIALLLRISNRRYIVLKFWFFHIFPQSHQLVSIPPTPSTLSTSATLVRTRIRR